jgi:hypothetical protein
MAYHKWAANQPKERRTCANYQTYIDNQHTDRRVRREALLSRIVEEEGDGPDDGETVDKEHDPTDDGDGGGHADVVMMPGRRLPPDHPDNPSKTYRDAGWNFGSGWKKPGGDPPSSPSTSPSIIDMTTVTDRVMTASQARYSVEPPPSSKPPASNKGKKLKQYSEEDVSKAVLAREAAGGKPNYADIVSKYPGLNERTLRRRVKGKLVGG